MTNLWSRKSYGSCRTILLQEYSEKIQEDGPPRENDRGIRRGTAAILPNIQSPRK